ncbi:MAG TPA: hypothetical protein VHB02_04600 [Acidimicrobiales bacterium]|nr:hypothetical protein [Acidimicrobiales bacterium]
MLPRPPVLLPVAVDDPSTTEELLVRHGPYWPVQRYVSNDAEYAALSGGRKGVAMPVASVFRGNWAVPGQVLPGVDPLLHNDRFVDGARRLFGAELVRPTTVYVNLTHQLPFPQGPGHTDVPAFRGFDRSTYPITFLTLMGLSGLFEEARVKVATAVSWFYRGPDGGFEYWPDGPDAPPVVHEGDIWNTGVVADNDFMWHRARPVGAPERGLDLLGLDAELVARDGAWAIVQDGAERRRFGRDELRVSLSWKAVVFVDDAERRQHDDHTADLTVPEVLRRFERDLTSRGRRVAIPDDPFRDPDFIGVLHDEYVRTPTSAAA